MQEQAAEQYEQEFEAFQSGKYKESAQNWLQSSWQGDALQVCLLWVSHTCGVQDQSRDIHVVSRIQCEIRRSIDCNMQWH